MVLRFLAVSMMSFDELCGVHAYRDRGEIFPGAARRELMHIRRDVDTNAVKHPHVCPRDPCAVAIELVAMKLCSGAANVLEKNLFYTMEVLGYVDVEDRLVRQHHLLDHLKDALVVGDRQRRPPRVDAHHGAMDAGSEDEVDLPQLTPPRLDAS